MFQTTRWVRLGLVLVVLIGLTGCLRGSKKNSFVDEDLMAEDAGADLGAPGGCGGCYAPSACDEAKGYCVNPGNACPTTLGPVGRIHELAIPGDAELSAQLCQDFDGNSYGDNSLRNLAEALNTSMAPSFQTNAVNAMVFEFALVQNLQEEPDFPLHLLFGTWDGSSLKIDPNAYGQGGVPQVRFPQTSIADWQLEGLSDNVMLNVPLMGVPVSLKLSHASVSVTLDPESSLEGGIQAGEGVLRGIASKPVFLQALADLKCGGQDATPPASTPAECCTELSDECTGITTPAAGSCDALAEAARPEYCKSLLLAAGLTDLFDLHAHEDGTFSKKNPYLEGDTAAICFTFKLKPVASVVAPDPATCPAK